MIKMILHNQVNCFHYANSSVFQLSIFLFWSPAPSEKSLDILLSWGKFVKDNFYYTAPRASYAYQIFELTKLRMDFREDSFATKRPHEASKSETSTQSKMF